MVDQMMLSLHEEACWFVLFVGPLELPVGALHD